MRLPAVVGLALLLMSSVSTGRNAAVVIKAGRIITISGDEIKDGIIIISGGRIEAVGKGIEVPWDATVIDASTKVVMPGFVEAHTFRGVDRPNENISSVPFVSTFDSINPLDPYFEESLRQGITTLFVVPGNQTMIGGQGCVLKPVGSITESMTIVKNHALKISLQARGSVSRMSHLAQLRREFDDLLDYIKDLDEKKRELPTAAGGTPGAQPEIEFKREVMARFLSGKSIAYVYCPTSTDVLRALELSRQYKVKMRLVLGRDTWKAAADIAREKADVILPADMVYWETDEDRHVEVLRVLPQIFSKAGVKFAFQTDGSSLGSNYMWYQAAVAVRHGMPRADALRAATLTPAEMLGMADRFGSIEKGKDGNLLILTGDPLDAQTWVDQVVIEGSIVYDRSKDAKLQRVLKATPDKK